MTAFIQNILLVGVVVICFIAIFFTWKNDAKTMTVPGKKVTTKKTETNSHNIIFPFKENKIGTRMIPTFVLEIQSGPINRSFDLTPLDQKIVIGGKRTDKDLKDIMIDDEFITTPHAVIYQKNNQFKISDCGSLNGSKFSKNNTIQPLGVGHVLEDGDEFILSPDTKIIVHDFSKRNAAPAPRTRQPKDLNGFMV